MSQSNLIELSYYDPAQGVRLTAYADTIVTESDGKHKTTSAIRFGGYPEMVRGIPSVFTANLTVERSMYGLRLFWHHAR